jgi:hypothetical protein
MKEKKTLKTNLVKAESSLKSTEKEMVYVGNDCVTQYWVHNDEHNCIAYGKIVNENDALAEQLKQQSKENVIRRAVEG